MPVPAEPKIYHITHIDNLESIIRDGYLWSDKALIDRDGQHAAIGMGSIKARRLELPVKCHWELNVGDCVPFYYCPRSVMLYILHKGNHLEVNYRGGQGLILHLEADLKKAIAWAIEQEKRWAFSLSNAGSYYAEFRNQESQFDEIDWGSVEARDFRNSDVKEGKQAEFLVDGSFPWSLIRRIGVASTEVETRVRKVLYNAGHKPLVEVHREWYF